MLPPFEPVHRLRRVEPLGSDAVAVDVEHPAAGSSWPVPQPAAYAAVVADLDPHQPAGALVLTLTSGATALAGHVDADGRTRLTVDGGSGGDGRPSAHASRRHGRLRARPVRVALTLTGAQLALSTDATGAADGSGWRVRARVDLADPRHPRLRSTGTTDPAWCAALRAGVEAGAPTRLRAGGAGAWGLRDVRAVTAADGAPLRADDGRLPLVATCAGPGFADAAHCGTFLLDPRSGDLERTGALFATRAGGAGVHGDHATQVLRDPDDPAAWLVATSTWGGFVAGRPGARVDCTLGRVAADPDGALLRGRHVVATAPLRLPVDGLASVGTWDPHLLHRDGAWEVAFVSARRYFDFHPAWASGPGLDDLALRGTDPAATATEGVTLVDLGDRLGGLHLLASDGRDGPRGRRARFPVLAAPRVPIDSADPAARRLREVGELAAAYPTNIPWPTVVPATVQRDGHDGWWLVTFDGTPSGGRLPGYGTHGDLVVLRARG